MANHESEKIKRENKRLKEFDVWLSHFKGAFEKQKARKIDCIPDASQILNRIYWSIMETYIRPIIQLQGEEESHINRFKIISATEFTIVIAQPFYFSDDSTSEDTKADEYKQKELNATFAWFVGCIILLSWTKDLAITQDVLYKVCSYKDMLNPDAPDNLSIRDEHINWLTYFNRDSSLPVFSNAQTWRLFEFSLLTLSDKIK